MTTPPQRQVRARYDDRTITVYQAFSPRIAGPALAAGRFVPPFSLDRMTWVKPSFLWMMYRCGWATKPGQERVLAIRITRAGFEAALAQACLSHLDTSVYPDHDAWRAVQQRSPVRVQWDPERDLDLNPLPWRSIQVGLGGATVRDYVERWVVDLTDVTDLAHELGRSRPRDAARLPRERPYPLPCGIASRLGATG